MKQGKEETKGQKRKRGDSARHKSRSGKTKTMMEREKVQGSKGTKKRYEEKRNGLGRDGMEWIQKGPGMDYHSTGGADRRLLGVLYEQGILIPRIDSILRPATNGHEESRTVRNGHQALNGRCGVMCPSS